MISYYKTGSNVGNGTNSRVISGKMKRIFAFLLLVFVQNINKSNGICNTCSGLTGLACVSQTTFKVCENGVIHQNGTTAHCPIGTRCTANAYVCDSNSNRLPTFCDECGHCLDGSSVACIGYNKYANCLEGGIVDLSKVYSCPTGLVCNSDMTPICYDPSVTGIGAQCPWEET